MSLFCFSLWIALVFFPRQSGKESRAIYDKFMDGWYDQKEKTEAAKRASQGT